MTEPATVQEMFVFAATCAIIGGLLLTLVGVVAGAARWGMTADGGDEEQGADIEREGSATVAKEADRHRRGAGTSVCTCSHATHDDGRGEWDSVTVEDVTDERCPIHGPAGRGWQWFDITSTADRGHVRYIRGKRLARSA